MLNKVSGVARSLYPSPPGASLGDAQPAAPCAMEVAGLGRRAGCRLCPELFRGFGGDREIDQGEVAEDGLGREGARGLALEGVATARGL